mmetsp:Transcript_121049/g.180815  ORF Transcript_121049/g.180815 Transcript_121049/m.180815 type:complete len:212 (-) Transcript_121049:494-1129(-)
MGNLLPRYASRSLHWQSCGSPDNETREFMHKDRASAGLAAVASAFKLSRLPKVSADRCAILRTLSIFAFLYCNHSINSIEKHTHHHSSQGIQSLTDATPKHIDGTTFPYVVVVRGNPNIRCPDSSSSCSKHGQGSGGTGWKQRLLFPSGLEHGFTPITSHRVSKGSFRGITTKGPHMEVSSAMALFVRFRSRHHRAKSSRPADYGALTILP